MGGGRRRIHGYGVDLVDMAWWRSYVYHADIHLYSDTRRRDRLVREGMKQYFAGAKKATYAGIPGPLHIIPCLSREGMTNSPGGWGWTECIPINHSR